QMGIGSIEPHEGMASLQALVGSDVRQLALLKTLNSHITDALNVSEAVTYYPRTAHSVVPRVQPALAEHVLAVVRPSGTNARHVLPRSRFASRSNTSRPELACVRYVEAGLHPSTSLGAP